MKNRQFHFLSHTIALLLLLIGTFFLPTAPLALENKHIKAQSQEKDIFDSLKPLPQDIPRTIQNPYWAKPAWKLWAEDPAPVTIQNPKQPDHITLQTIPKQHRRIPFFPAKPGSKMLLRPWLNNPKSLSGFWDDCYMSLDNNHSHVRVPDKQLLDAGAMRTEANPLQRLELGVNFTTQSYFDRNRAIVDDTYNILYNEKYFFFANMIRATPATDSFSDNLEAGVTDYYDSLFSHSYQSLGKSGSETHAIYKMMIAGASMPRAVKNLLKRNGAYAITLLSLYKAALPYTDANGSPLAYEHELRHRPVYSSSGDVKSTSFCAANTSYHGYNDALHLWNMAQMAQAMKIAPPVTILKIDGIAIRKDQNQIIDKQEVFHHIKSYSPTGARIWGKPGETLAVQFNLKRSYDLQNKPLTFRCKRQYPNQKNLSIMRTGPASFSASVTHDPNLPKGRIPVICTTRNGGTLPGNPVFLNFYWPDQKERANYLPRRGLSPQRVKELKKSGLKRRPATINKRPRVSFGILGDAIPCRSGETIRIPIQVTDPEGYSVEVFKYAGERGHLTQQGLEITLPTTSKPKIIPIHLIFSDGTGGYSGKKLKLLLNKSQDTLPKNWAVTVLGSENSSGSITSTGNIFSFTGRRLRHDPEKHAGLFTFTDISGKKHIDLVTQIISPPSRGDIAILLTNTLDDAARYISAGNNQGSVFGLVRPREMTWGSYRTIFPTDKAAASAHFFRIIARNGNAAVLVSQDKKHWTQLAEDKISWFNTVYGGLLYTGSKHQLKAQWLKPETPLPLLLPVHPQKNKNGEYSKPLKISLDIPSSLTAKLTLNGASIFPNLETNSVKYLILEKSGKYTIKAALYSKNVLVGTVEKSYILVGE